MALMTAASVPGNAPVQQSQTAVSASDTISSSDVGERGALLQVFNSSGGSLTVTILDPGVTSAGNPGTVTGAAQPNASNRFFRIQPRHVDPATGVATVTFSATTSVTYKLIRL